LGGGGVGVAEVVGASLVGVGVGSAAGEERESTGGLLPTFSGGLVAVAWALLARLLEALQRLFARLRGTTGMGAAGATGASASRATAA